MKKLDKCKEHRARVATILVGAQAEARAMVNVLGGMGNATARFGFEQFMIKMTEALFWLESMEHAVNFPKEGHSDPASN